MQRKLDKKLSNSLEEFKCQIKSLLSEAMGHKFVVDPAGSIKLGQMVIVGKKRWGTIVSVPDRFAPIVKIFFFDGKYHGYIESEFETLLTKKRVVFIK